MQIKEMFEILALCFLLSRSAETKNEEFWIGKGPICEGASYECSSLDMDLIKFDEKGPPDSESCQEGFKALCRLPKPKEFEQKPIDPTKTELKILNLDMNLRDAFQSGVQYKGEHERICFVGRVIQENFPEVDVVVLFGMKSKNCLKTDVTIYDYMIHYGWNYNVKSDDTIIFSKHEIQKFKALYYISGIPSSIVASVRKQGQAFWIITYDLHDQFNTRNFKTQLSHTEVISEQISRYLAENTVEEQVATIFVESIPFDTQVEAYKVGSINLLLNAQLLIPSLKASVSKQNNEFAETYLQKWYKFESPAKTSSQENCFAVLFNGLKPSRFKFETIENFKTDKTSPIIYCNFETNHFDHWIFHNSNQCQYYKQTHQLSSHYPVLGTFTFY